MIREGFLEEVTGDKASVYGIQRWRMPTGSRLREKGVKVSFGQFESEVPVLFQGVMSSRYCIHGYELLLYPFYRWES